MSKSIYKLTRQLAIILSITLSIVLQFEGEHVRSLMNLLLLVVFLYTSKVFERKSNLITTSYIFIFIIMYVVNSLTVCFFTENRIRYLNEIGTYGYWTNDYYAIYFIGILLSYIVINVYLRYFCKETIIKSSDITFKQNEILNMQFGCVLALILYLFVNKSHDIIIPVLSFSIIVIAFPKSRKSKIINIILCLIVCLSFKEIFTSRYKFVQIIFPVIEVFLIITRLNEKNIKMRKIWGIAIVSLAIAGIYGTVSEVYKLNTNWGENYDIIQVFTSLKSLMTFFIKQIYRIFAIWIKLGSYIIDHVNANGFFYGLTYIKSLSPIFGFEHISLPKISAIYDGANYAQPGLVAEGYANFGILGIVINICSVFFLMEFFRRRFNKNKNCQNLIFMTIPFTKIILDGGTFNSAIMLICSCLIINILNIIEILKSKFNNNVSNENMISVLMSVYNTEETYLKESIQSILNQTYTNFEFLIFDDCSNDKVKTILREYAEKDNRIILIENNTNKGLTCNLNTGVKIAKGKYICRQDADDISLKTRFSKQIAYMEKHPKIDVLGTGYHIIEENGDIIGTRLYGSANPEYIKARLFLENSHIMHSSVMIRTDFLRENNLNYNTEIKKSQDYDLWVRTSKIGNISILKERLCYYRVHKNQISSEKNKKSDQKKYFNDILLKQLDELKILYNDEERNAHIALSGSDITISTLHNVRLWRNKLLKSTQIYSTFNSRYIKIVIWKRYIKFLIKRLKKVV